MVSTVQTGGSDYSLNPCPAPVLSPHPTNPTNPTKLSALAIRGAERLHPFKPRWNEDDGEVATDVVHIVLLALTDDLVRGLVSLWASHFWQLGGSGGSGGMWEALPLWMQVAAALLVGEVGGFGSHWLLHVRRLPFWQLHRVHHAVQRLYVLNTYVVFDFF